MKRLDINDLYFIEKIDVIEEDNSITKELSIFRRATKKSDMVMPFIDIDKKTAKKIITFLNEFIKESNGTA